MIKIYVDWYLKSEMSIFNLFIGKINSKRNIYAFLYTFIIRRSGERLVRVQVNVEITSGSKDARRFRKIFNKRTNQNSF